MTAANAENQCRALRDHKPGSFRRTWGTSNSLLNRPWSPGRTTMLGGLKRLLTNFFLMTGDSPRLPYRWVH